MDAALSVAINVFKTVLSIVSQKNSTNQTELKSIINVIKHGMYAEYRRIEYSRKPKRRWSDEMTLY